MGEPITKLPAKYNQYKKFKWPERFLVGLYPKIKLKGEDKKLTTGNYKK